MNQKLRNQMTQLYLGLAIPLLLAVLLVNLLGFRMLKKQQVQIRAAGLERYAQQLGNEMSSIQSHLVTFCTSETDINNMQYLDDESARILASKRLIDRMKNDVTFYEDVQIEFLYSGYLKISMIARRGTSSFDQMQRQNAIVQDLVQRIEQDSIAEYLGTWQVCSLEGDSYLVYCYSNGDAYVGILLDTKNILTLPDSLSTSSEVTLWQNGEIIASLHTNKEPCKEMISAAIGNTGITIRICAEDTGKWEFQRSWPALFIMLFVCVIATLLVLYYFTSARIVNPIHNIVDKLKQVGDGDRSTRIETEGMLEELASIGQAINHTLDQIDRLQEKEQDAIRQEQMSRLRNLQMQINPHFLGNCLNMLNNASLCGDAGQVFALTSHLSGYFRCMGQMEQNFITLENELQFTRDFLEIQKIRFPGQFSYQIYAPAFLKQISIPPSVIKSFAENSVQYSRRAGKEVLLEIEVSLRDDAQPPVLDISIQDNGPGFRADVLALLREDSDPFFDGRMHIGITNVKKRLQILYGNRSNLSIGNSEGGGAWVKMQIPLEQKGANGVCSMY